MTQSEYNISTSKFYITFTVVPNANSKGGEIVFNQDQDATYDEMLLSFTVVEDGNEAHLADVKLIPSTSRCPVSGCATKETYVSSLC